MIGFTVFVYDRESGQLGFGNLLRGAADIFEECIALVSFGDQACDPVIDEFQALLVTFAVVDFYLIFQLDNGA